MSRRIVAGLLAVGWMGWGSPVQAEWVSLSQGLPEAEVSFLAASPKDPDTLYAASPKRVYRRAGGEAGGWKQVLSMRGSETQIHHLLSDSLSPGILYVASDKGVQKSDNVGKKWSWIYRGVGEKARTVLFICEDPQDAASLWLGTGQGLVRISKDGHEAVKIASFPETAVHSIRIPEEGAFFLADAADGIYKSADKGQHWEKVLAGHEASAEENASTTLSQFQIEELQSGPSFSSIVHVPAQKKYLTASPNGIFESGADASGWKKMAATLPAEDVRHLAASSETFYAATARGVFQWDETSGLFKDLSDGLPSQDVRTLFYHPFSGDLYAATKKGVYRYPKPELKLPAEVLNGKPELQNVLDRFKHEPTILEVQRAAERYAEVYPEKIEAWRRAAMRKAVLPTISLTADQGEDHNVDIDRGGTNDPDRFIIGPSETNLDWHMGVSWDLGELIWNNDQTSIDTRSKLMVELRDDILNEVTHYYFERRRLQTEMILHPSKELPLQIEKELKLQELTADIDALTGGYLSQRLGEVTHVEIG